MHPLIVCFIIGVIVAANEWHESFFWTMIGFSVLGFLFMLALEIKKARRAVKIDQKMKETFPSYKPEPKPKPIAGQLCFTIIVGGIIWFFVFYALSIRK